MQGAGAGANDCRRGAGAPRVRAVRPPRIELSSTPGRARPPPSRARRRPPTLCPARRPRRAAARAARAPRAARRRGVASPRCRDSHARSCAWGVLAWRRRSGLSGKGRSCADGAVPWGPAREPIPAPVPRSKGGGRSPTLAQMVQVTTARESTPSTTQHGRGEHAWSRLRSRAPDSAHTTCCTWV